MLLYHFSVVSVKCFSPGFCASRSARVLNRIAAFAYLSFAVLPRRLDLAEYLQNQLQEVIIIDQMTIAIIVPREQKPKTADKPYARS